MPSTWWPVAWSASSAAGTLRATTSGWPTLGPGVAFGEMAVLDRMPRSTSAWAEVASTCHVLDKAEFDRLEQEHPGVATALLRNLARTLSGRLRRANAEIRLLS